MEGRTVIVIVMGMSKSGTTLTARTLHNAGINMGAVEEGSYPRCPYEDDLACEIMMEQVGIDRKKSLYLPDKIRDLPDRIKYYVEMRSKKGGDWGVKFPYMTLVYDIWRRYLPDHIPIALKRNPEGLVGHYARRGEYWSHGRGRELILAVQSYYNYLIDSYNVPVIRFEDLIKNGPGAIEKIIGRELPDVREPRKR